VSGTNIRAGYACTGNALVGLVGIRGKTSFGGQLYLENCARTLAIVQLPAKTKVSLRMPTNQM